MKKRVITYIDGFNLYFGLKSKGWRKYYWLNLFELSNNILQESQTLVKVKYFTARIEEPEEKRKRQLYFLEALETLNKIEMFFGKYLTTPMICRNCGAKWIKSNEKETDVNIAIELLTDAIMDGFDTALIISGDSDLAPAIKRTKQLCPRKRIISVFPPKRVSNELKNCADGYFNLSESKIKCSLFPDEIMKPNGFILHKPAEWK
ncbi:NYN domain-containing protein [Bacteroidetes/Chlorobi group bacterium ChocPot_Mid]|nr:MAG: NYN domain-containing protein [Bacteroidetes/Chlorobi group bacterium ChocPot_Mid]